MMVTVMQVLDTSITNVALPHMQGSFSASIDEMSWVITSYLAANAVVIPASGCLTAALGRRPFFFTCTATFTGTWSFSGFPPIPWSSVFLPSLQVWAAGPLFPLAPPVWGG